MLFICLDRVIDSLLNGEWLSVICAHHWLSHPSAMEQIGFDSWNASSASNDTEPWIFSEDPSTDKVIGTVVVVFDILICLGPVDNILTLLAVYKKPALRTTSNILVVHLAITDLACAFVIFHSITSQTVNSEYVCLLSSGIAFVALGSSASTLLAIAIERYLAIVHPFLHQTYITDKLLMLACAFTWIIPVLLHAPLWVSNKWVSGIYCMAGNLYHLWFMILVDIAQVLILGNCLVLYFKIFRVAIKQRRAIQVQENAVNKRSGSSMSKDLKAAKMMFTVLFVLLLFFCPMTVANILESLYPFNEQGTLFRTSVVFANHIVLGNSIVNPIIYACQNRQFRSAYKEILGIKLKPSGESIS